MYGWLVSVGVPCLCMGLAYAVASGNGKKFKHQNTASSTIDHETPSANSSGSGNRKLEKRKRQREIREHRQRSVASILSSLKSSSSSVVEKSSSSESEEEVDITRLSKLKNIANLSATHSSGASNASTILSSDSSIVMQTIEDDGTWAKIPTRQEEIIQTLKCKISTLTEQIEAVTLSNSEQHKLLEVSNKKVQMLEYEIKERTRILQNQIIATENELKAAQAEVDASIEQATQFKLLEDEISVLQEKLSEMQVELTKNQEQTLALINEHQNLSKERDLFISENGSLGRQLSEAKKHSESLSTEVSQIKKAFELEQLARSALFEELEATKVSLSEAKSKLITIEDLSVNIQKLEAQVQFLTKNNEDLKEEIESKSKSYEQSIIDLKLQAKEAHMIPSYCYQYMELLMNNQKSFLAEKASLLTQIIELKRKL